MKRNLFLLVAIISVVGMIAISGCKKNDDDGGSGNGGNSKKEKYITSDEEAAQVARQLWFAINEIDGSIDVGTYSDYVVSASGSGTAKVSGSITRHTPSGAWTETRTSKLTITFDHFVLGGYYDTSADYYTFTGTITSDQSSYSSSNYKWTRYVEGNNIEIEGNGIKDVIAVDLQRYHNSSTTPSRKFPIAGGITSSSGERYSVYDGWE